MFFVVNDSIKLVSKFFYDSCCMGFVFIKYFYILKILFFVELFIFMVIFCMIFVI